MQRLAQMQMIFIFDEHQKRTASKVPQHVPSVSSLMQGDGTGCERAAPQCRRSSPQRISSEIIHVQLLLDVVLAGDAELFLILHHQAHDRLELFSLHLRFLKVLEWSDL